MQEKLRLKEEKEAAEAKYKVASVDGKKEKVRTLHSASCCRFRFKACLTLQSITVRYAVTTLCCCAIVASLCQSLSITH